MTTRMVHPQHGATHAYDTGEIDRLKGLGWAAEGDKPFPIDPPAVFTPEAVAELAYGTVHGFHGRKKPGPKPKAK